MKLTDLAGKPVVGSAVVAIYDKARRIHFRRLECRGDQSFLLAMARAQPQSRRILLESNLFQRRFENVVRA